MNNLISIIIPIYNVEQVLKRCIDSVINQTYKNLEIILVDDGSTDNSGKICDEYVLKDKRIKVIHKENGGVSSARNAGLDVVTGEYIGFVDSDDYIERDMYEFLFNLIEKNDIASCNIFYDKNVYYKGKTTKSFIGMDAFKACLNNKNMFVSVWNKLYRNNIIANIRFLLISMSEDLFFLYTIFSNNNSMIVSNVPKYHYVSDTRVICFEKRDLESLDIFIKILNNEKELNRKNYIKDIEKEYLRQLFAIYIKSCFYENRISNEKIIELVKDEKFKFMLNRKISLKFKLFIIVLFMNKKIAKLIYTKIIKKNK